MLQIIREIHQLLLQNHPGKVSKIWGVQEVTIAFIKGQQDKRLTTLKEKWENLKDRNLKEKGVLRTD